LLLLLDANPFELLLLLLFKLLLLLFTILLLFISLLLLDTNDECYYANEV